MYVWNLTLTKKVFINNKKHCTASCPTNVPPKHHIKRYKRQNEPLKTVRLTSFQKPIIAIRFYLLQVCPSFPPFVSAALFIPSFHILICYFFVSLDVMAVPTVSCFFKINSETQLRRSLIYKECFMFDVFPRTLKTKVSWNQPLLKISDG